MKDLMALRVQNIFHRETKISRSKKVMEGMQTHLKKQINGVNKALIGILA